MEIIYICITYKLGDLIDFIIVVKEQLFGVFYADFVYIDVEIPAGSFVEEDVYKRQL